MITLRHTEPVPQTTAAPAAMEVVPLRRPSRYVLGAVLLFLIVAGIDVLLNNPRFQWDVVGEYLFSRPILDGLYVTLWLTGATMILASVLGVGIAVMRLSTSRVASTVASAYIWFFRGTPLLVQLVFWYNLSALFPRLELGVPFGGPTFFTADANSLITPLVAGLMGLALHEAAYMAEIIRSGILSVDPGQREAASALGMTGFQTFRRILLPQAVRVIVPPAGNELITTLKMTSLVSVVAVADLMYTVQQISARTFESIPLLIVASLWYLAIVSVLSVGQHYLERRFSRGVAGMERPHRSLIGRRRHVPAAIETRES